MALPQPTPIANKPKPGSLLRLYLCPEAQGTIAEADEIPLIADDPGVKGSGEVPSIRSHNGGMLYAKVGISKTFSFQMLAASDNAKVAEVLTAADGNGDDAIMKFVIYNPDGSYDYGFCIVNDKSVLAAADGIFGYTVNCSVIGDGEFQAAA